MKANFGKRIHRLRRLACLWIVGVAIAQAVAAQPLEWHRFTQGKAQTGIFEPSAVRQLADGRLFVVQDEASAAFSTLTLSDQGLAQEFSPNTDALGKALPRLNDLEGLALGPNGALYAITSFSHMKSGKRPATRQIFAQVHITAGEITRLTVYDNLLGDIIAAYPALKSAKKSPFAKGRRGFNIEGLGFDRSGKNLLIGLRGPVLGKDSLILRLENPSGVFKGQPPRFSPDMIRLDLNKAGIRALSYIPALGVYLLVAQKANKKGASNLASHLWVWSGDPNSTPTRLDIPGLDLRNAEGITQIRHMDRDYIFLVSDDGDRAKARPAHYTMLPVSLVATYLPNP